MYFFFVLGLSTFSSENRTLENIRITTIVLSALGIFPGIYFNAFYFKTARYRFLQREGVPARRWLQTKKSVSGEGDQIIRIMNYIFHI